MSFRARRLARDIAAAQSASAALRLLRSADVDQIDQIHVTACLHRMASLSAHSKPRPGEVQELLSYMEPEFFTAEMLAINSWSLAKLQKAESEHLEDLRQQLLQLAVERRSEFSARHFSNLLWSAAHGQEVFLTDLANELPQHLQDMSPQGLANCFWAISKLAGDGRLEASLLAKALPERAQELKPMDLASILWSASCFSSAFMPLIDALEARLLQVASRLSTRQLTNAAWAVATVDPRKQRAVEILVEQAIVACASERDLPNLCWALAAVRGKAGGISETVQGLKQPPTLGMLWALSVTGSYGAGPLLMAGVSKGHYDALLYETPDASQLAQFLWCQATAGGSGSKLLMAAAERVEEFSSLDLSRCAWAAAVLESEPAAAHLALRAAQVLVDESGAVASATLVQVTWSLTRLQLFVPRLLERLTRLRGSELRTQDLALGVWVLAFWHFVGDRCLLDEMSTCWISEFGAQDLANVAWAMAVQLVSSEALVVALAVEAERKLAAMAPQHLCNLIWAFATISWRGDRSTLILSLSKEVRQRSCELETLGLAAASWGFAMAVGGGPLGCGS